MREATTTLLDAVAMVTISAGVAGGLWPLIEWWSLCIAGFVLLFGSLVAAVRGGVDG